MKHVLALSALALLLSFGVANAQTITAVPTVMNFQGRLAKPNGTPVPDGTYNLTLGIYNDPNAIIPANLLWQEYEPGVTVKNGVFAVLLGTTTALNDGIFNGTVYFDIKINGDAPLRPRQKFVTTAYAFKANTVPDGTITNVKVAPGLDFNKLVNVPTTILSLPYSGAANTTGSAFVVTNNGNGVGITGVSVNGSGITAQSTNSTGLTVASTNGYGIVSNSSKYAGVSGRSVMGTGTEGSSTSGIGTSGISINYIGLYSQSTNSDGVNGQSTGLNAAGVSGNNTLGYGVFGQSNSGYGVYGQSVSRAGVYGFSTDNYGVIGSSNTNNGIYGTSVSGSAGYFAGNVVVTGTFSNPSDARYKTNIVALNNALEEILALRGVTYDYKRDDFKAMNFPQGKQVGFIAQELEKVLPELVHTDKEGYKSVDYIHVVPVLVEAIKAQQQKIDAQGKQLAEIAELKSQLAALTASLHELKAAQDKVKTAAK